MLGSVVYAQTEGGTVMRSRPRATKGRSEAQEAASRRLERAQAIWNGLDDGEVRAWRDYALREAGRDPRTGGTRRLAANWVFKGLAAKYLQVHGGLDAPRLPPEGAFRGDLLDVTVEGLPRALRFASGESNRPGVLTELMVQRLKNRNNETRPRSYVSLGFVAFRAGVPVEVPAPFVGHAALAVRYVEAATGRMTEIVEIGRVTVVTT